MPRQLVTQDGKTYSFKEYEMAQIGPLEVRVRTLFAAPKHGTESHMMAGSAFDRKQWNPDLRMFLAKSESQSPTAAERSIGNTIVGEIIAIGPEVTRFKIGDHVFGYGAIQEEHQAPEAHWHSRQNLTVENAVCVDPAHVAFVAVRDGNIRIGDAVAVYGLGAIGLLAVQIARASGARQVFAVDPAPLRRAYAAAHGADAVFDPNACDAALEIKHATGNKGVDVSLETSGNSRALHDAIRCIRQCGTVVHVAWGPENATHLHLDEEWHLNRPTLIGSQAVWNNPDRSHPLWDKARAWQTVTDLFDANILTAAGLVTPIISFEQAPELLAGVFLEADAAIKVGVSFD